MELLVAHAGLLLVRAVPVEPLVHARLEVLGQEAAVVEQVLEAGREVDLRALGPREAVEQVLGQRRGAVLHRTREAVLLAREFRQRLERVEVELDLGDRAVGQRHATVAGARLDRDLAHARLARGELLSPSSTKVLLNLMSQVKSGPQRLKAGVPYDWAFVHKTGTGQDLPPVSTGYNDIGIMTAPDGTRYAVVVMMAETTATVPQRMQFMQSISSGVAVFHNR